MLTGEFNVGILGGNELFGILGFVVNLELICFFGDMNCVRDIFVFFIEELLRFKEGLVFWELVCFWFKVILVIIGFLGEYLKFF